MKITETVRMSADSLTRSLQTADQDLALVDLTRHFSLTEHYFHVKKWLQTDHRRSHS